MIAKKILSFSFLFSISISLTATTFYVSNNGSNSNSGLSLSDAFETIQHAVDLSGSSDSVLVENGTYVGFAVWNGGTSNASLIIQALGDEVIINQPCSTTDGINVENADYVYIDGFQVINQPRNGIRVVNANYVYVQNCRCDNNFERGIFTAFADFTVIQNNICTNSIDEHGIYVSNSSDNPVIRFNECFGNNNIGIHMNGDLSAGGDGIISDPVIYGNIIHDNNLAAGINLDGVENARIYNNLIYNNHNAQGIALFQQDGAVPTTGSEIFNNTIIVPDDGRWGILVNTGANVNTNIFNNIILNQHAWRGSITTESIENFSCDFNIVNDKLSDSGDGSTITFDDWQNLGLGLNSQVADLPEDIFEDFLQNDFHLPENSQAVDAGNNVAFLLDDIEGNPRPFGSGFDIGAYEYQGITMVLNDLLDRSNISFYPNPFKSEIQIESETIKTLDFSLKNMSGQTLFSGKIRDNKIHVGDIPGGTYILTIRNLKGEILHTGLIVKI